MKDGPLVSVILPTYNRASLLVEAMESVLRQTYPHLELIVVDDGSTDDTAQQVHRFADPRIRYLRLDANRGVSHARNRGLQEARGELIAFQDSDDLWAPDKLARQVRAFLEADRPVGVWGSWEVLYPDGHRHRFPRQPPRENESMGVSLLHRGRGICPQVLLLPASWAKRSVFPESLSNAEDVVYVLRLARLGLPFVFVPYVLATVRRFSEEAHLSLQKSVRPLLVWERSAPELQTLRDRIGFRVWYVAPTAIRAGWKVRPFFWVLQGLWMRVLSLRDAVWFGFRLFRGPGGRA